MIATALILLIIGHALLIRGCFKINQTLPTESGYITTEIRQVSGVLDEVADLLNELLNSGGAMKPIPNQPPNLIESLLNSFLNKTPMASDYGDQTQQNEWEIFETDENPLKTKE